jgi:hypothetical protein
MTANGNAHVADSWCTRKTWLKSAVTSSAENVPMTFGDMTMSKSKAVWKLTSQQEALIQDEREDFERLFGKCFIERLTTYEGGGMNVYYPPDTKTAPVEWSANIDELRGWLRGAVTSQEIIRRYKDELLKKKQTQERNK